MVPACIVVIAALIGLLITVACWWMDAKYTAEELERDITRLRSQWTMTQTSVFDPDSGQFEVKLVEASRMVFDGSDQFEI